MALAGQNLKYLRGDISKIRTGGGSRKKKYCDKLEA